MIKISQSSILLILPRSDPAYPVLAALLLSDFATLRPLQIIGFEPLENLPARELQS